MKKNIFENLNKSIIQWIHLNIMLLLMMLICRIIFYVETTTRINIEASQFANVILGFKYDLLLTSHFIAWIFPIFLILHHFFPQKTVKTYRVLIFIYAIISTLLTEYFCNLMMPLDHVIFAYSIEGLKGTISSSSSFSIIPILFLALSIFLFVFISRLWSKVKIGKFVAYIAFLASIIFSISYNYKNIIHKELYCDTHDNFIIATNQPSYSFIKIYDFLHNKDIEKNTEFKIIEEITKSYQQLNDNSKYPYIDYPFYRKADYQDVLGSLLNKTSDSIKPNFVFIIVESFGQCLTGVENPTISFTPFIDSLKNESLYWQNCLSATERTFGVLPTIFASTPHGLKGFAHPYHNMTSHNSLLKDLRKNDYEISYYYGCYRDADRYDNFLQYNEIDNIFIPTAEVVDEEKYNMMIKNNRWGLDDKELFDIAINNRKSSNNNKPFVDIIMTLSTHEPFVILEGQEDYEQKAQQILESSNTINTKEKNNVDKNLNVFACYLYMDECVKNLMDKYKSIPGYENTIFIITGDHRTSVLNTRNVLRSFNVPLIIYSPLLKKDKQMKAIVSHYDITPTINAYLSNNYDYKIDDYCHWLGKSLDTVKEFRSNVKQAFMLNNRDVIDYVNGEYFLCRSNLFKINENLELTAVDNPLLYERFKKELNDYNTLSIYAVESNFLNNDNDNDLINIADYYFDFDNTSHKIYNVLDSLDNKFAYFNENVEYISLYPYYIVDDDYTQFRVNVSFDLKTYTDNKLPILVFSVGDFYQSVPLISMYDESLNTGNLEHFNKKINIVNKGKSYKGEKLKIYFWNTSKDRMMFDNVKVLIKASK